MLSAMKKSLTNLNRDLAPCKKHSAPLLAEHFSKRIPDK